VCGYAYVAYTIEPDGSVTNLTLVSVRPHQDFANAAIEAMRQRRYAPAREADEALQLVMFVLE
jgi:TonB family protein